MKDDDMMMHKKGKRLLAILLAAMLCFSSVALNCVLAEATATVEEAPKQEESKPEEPKPEAPKQEAPKAEEPKAEAPKQEEAKAEEPKPEAPKQEESKPEVPKEETPKVEEPKQEASNQEPPAPVQQLEESKPSSEATQVPVVLPTDAPELTVTPEPTPTPEPTEIPETPVDPENPEGDVLPEEPEATENPDAGIESTATPEPTPTPAPEHVPSFEMRGRSKAWSDLHLDPGSLRIPSDGMPIPLLYQFDYKKSVCRVDGDSKSVASSGCGAAAASMLIAYIRQNYDQTPYTLFYWAADHGRYRGDGLDYEGIRTLLINHGVDTRLLSASSEGIISALKENRPIIIKMGPGTFTDGGHYIVLRGLDEDGNVLVNDPNSSSRSQRSYSASLIARECKSDHMIVAYTLPGGAEKAKEAEPKQEAAAEPMVTVQETPEPVVEEEENPAPVEAASETEDGVFEGSYLARVSYKSVNLREAPVDGLVVTSVKEGAVLRVINEVSAEGRVWCAVEYEGNTLYIRGDMIATDNIGMTMAEYEAQAADVAEPETIEEVPAPVPVSEQLNATEDGVFEESYLAVVNYKSVNLRDVPGTNKQESLVVTSVPKGTTLCVVGEEVDEDGRVWCAVLYQNQQLYIRGDMLTVLN